MNMEEKLKVLEQENSLLKELLEANNIITNKNKTERYVF